MQDMLECSLNMLFDSFWTKIDVINGGEDEIRSRGMDMSLNHIIALQTSCSRHMSYGSSLESSRLHTSLHC